MQQIATLVRKLNLGKGQYNTSLQGIFKFHIPVGFGTAGVRYDGGVVPHVVVVQAEPNPDPWTDGGWKN